MSDILRWVADQYRQKLLQVDQGACHEVDLVMTRAGQGWVCEESIINPDDVLTAAEIEAKFGIREFTIRALARRYGVEIRGRRGLANLYRLGDILSARAAKKSYDNFR